MAKKTIELDLDIKGNIEPTVANLKKLKMQLKDTAAGSEEFKKIYNQIDDLEDKIKGARKGSADWIDTLESAGGPLGALGAALNKAKVATVSFGTALKATGLGLIVATVGLLVTAFTKTEGSMKKLEPVMIQLEKILGGLVEAFQPLIEGFANLAMDILPYAVKGITTFYGSLVSLFTLIKEAGSGIGKVLTGIFTGDSKAITEGYDQLKGSWDKTIQRYDQFQADYDKGSKKLTATEKKNLEERKKNQEEADKKAEEQRKAQEEIIFRAELAKANEFDKRRLEARKKLLEDEKAANSNQKALIASRQIYALTLIEIDKDQTEKRRGFITELATFEQQTIQNSIAAQQEQIRLVDLKLSQEGKVRDKFNKNLNQNERISLIERQSIFDTYWDSDRKEQRKRAEILFSGEKDKVEKLKEFDEKTIILRKLTADTLKTQTENLRIKELTDLAEFNKQVLQLRKELGEKEISQAVEDFNKESEFLDNTYYLEKKGKDKAYYDSKIALVDEEVTKINAAYVKQIDTLNQSRREGLINEKQYNKQRTEIEQEYTKNIVDATQKRIDISNAEKNAKLSDLESIAASLGTLATAFADYTAAYKIAALAQIAIDTGVAISRVIATISAGPAASNPFTYVAAIASQIAIITVNIAKATRLIEGASIPTPTTPGANVSNTNFGPTPINVVATRASGGFVYGRGTDRSDSIPTMLSNGEFVVNSQSAGMFAPLLQTINSIGNQPQFRMNGMVGNNNSLNSGLESLAQTLSGNMSSRPVQTYVVSQQVTNQQQLDRTIKSRSLM